MKIKHYINLALNVTSHEWPRIIFAWLVKFVAHASFVMASTVLLALFVEEYGVPNLPFLYIISALFVVFGSAIFSFFIERLTKRAEILIVTLAAAVLLYLAPSFATNTMLFYGTMFVALSLFVTQLNILLALYIEELFSPSESERIFPIVESSEPIGGIFAGLFLTLGVKVFNLSALDLLFWIALFLTFIVPVLLIFLKFINRIPKLEHKTEKEDHVMNRFQKTAKGLRHIRSMPFLKGMAVIVFLQFAFINLIEFQYTSVLEASLKHGDEQIEEVSSHSVPDVDVHDDTAIEEHHAAASDGDHSHADALTHGLAFWHVLFSLFAFVAQTFTASRIHSRLGVIHSMRLHPIASFFSSLAMMLKFGFVSAVAARGIFEVTMIMHRTTYHASFYALKRSIREHVKEFMEGVVRPLGMIAGTLLLLGVVSFVPEQYQNEALSAVMMLIMFFMFSFLSRMRSQYTLVAKKNLDAKNSNEVKLEAIEILAQRGHDNVTVILGKNMHDKQHTEIQCKILETLGKIQDVDAIADIVRMFESPEKRVRLAAVEALGEYKNLGQHFFSQSFAKYRVIDALQKLFLNAKSKSIKSAVIYVFRNINNTDVIPFLLKRLDSKDPDIIADAIHVCGLFKDSNSAYYIEKFLHHEHPRVRSTAIIALWNFPQYRLKALIQLTQMIESKDVEQKISGVFALGEVGAVQEIPRLKSILEESDNPFVQCHAAIALAKMGEQEMAYTILDFLMSEDEKLAHKAKKLAKKTPKSVQKMIKNLVSHTISQEIHKILMQHKGKAIGELPKKILKELKKYYEVLGEVKEMLKIEEELERRSS